MLLHFTNISKQDVTLPMETGALKSISLLRTNDSGVVEVQWTDAEFMQWRYSTEIKQLCGDPDSYIKNDTKVVVWMLRERPKNADGYVTTTVNCNKETSSC